MGEITSDGIVLGLIVFFISQFIVIVYKKVIHPWLKNLTYDGVNLSGNWVCNYDGNLTNDPNQRIIITQSGSKLSGVIRIIKWATGEPANEELIFQGSIKGEKVIITFYDKIRTNLGMGAIVFQIQDNGATLKGSVVSVEPTDLTIYSEIRKWTKN